MDIRVASYGVIIDGDRILLAHWREGRHNGWTLPGGGIDPGEHPADAAVREIREETGYIAELDGLLGIDSFVAQPENRITPGATQPLHGLRIIYRAHVTDGELTYELDGSTDLAAWHPLSEVPTLKRVSLVDIALGMLEL
ncbi:8-oxo-dGTP diphosphatase [Mycetocola sp. CAN_C7]|uniref:NUDIX hydrolase n=1 Tax=Mycetocola sp. CAN_C7 TaxID=2787724 RepID=UPI0018C98A58